MTEKAKLTKAQAEAIEGLRKENVIWKNEAIIRYHMRSRWGALQNECLEKLSLDTLIRALYIGYEVEETEEEKVFRLAKHGMSTFLTTHKEAYRIGFCDALLALGREDLWKEVKDL